MNNYEYIYKAVELATGWEWATYQWAQYSSYARAELELADGAVWRNNFEDCYTAETMPQIFIDALAAQLYRQCVDVGSQVAWLCNGIDTIKDIIDHELLS